MMDVDVNDPVIGPIADNLARTRTGSIISALELGVLFFGPLVVPPEVSQKVQYGVELSYLAMTFDFAARAVSGQGFEGIARDVRDYFRK
jgi:hypothetical protein